MKNIFKVDLLMLIFAVSSVFTGIQIHYANDFQTHEIWHNWSLIHVFVNVAFLIVGTLHIKQHWAWYKTLFKKGKFTLKSKITMLVSLSFLILTLSGIALLLFVEGQGSKIGFFHYVCGLIFGAIGLGHFIKRWKVFKKGVCKN